MARTCTICSHKKRRQINAALAASESLRNIAERFDVPVTNLFRHKQTCLAPLVQEVIQEQKTEDKHILATALDRVQRDMALITDALGAVWKEDNKDVELLLPVLRESRQQNRLFAALTGELRQQNVIASPEMQEVLSFLLDAVQGIPNAHEAIVTSLEAYRAKRGA